MIYFDNAATTYPKPNEVYEGINYAMKEYAFNAGRGSYIQSLKTYEMIQKTRRLIADYACTAQENVIFTSSATESINNIILGLNILEGDNVYVSPFEHNAIIRTLSYLKANIIIIPFNKETWEIDNKTLENMYVLNKPKLTVISHISNVTGFMLPYNEIFALSKKYNSINILDSAQAFGVYKIDNENCTIDFTVFTGHKSLYAMFGVGGYINYNKRNLNLTKVGGTGSDSLNLNMPEEFPYRYEAGSYNSVGIYSIFCGLTFLNKNTFDIIKRDLCAYFLEKIRNYPRIKVFLPQNYVPFGIISFKVEGYSSDEIGDILSNDYDICVRTGYHCAPFVHDFIGSKISKGTVRISFSGFNTKEEINVLLKALSEL